MPGPGFEPGLLRPQRSVLTTRQSRLTTPRWLEGDRKLFLLLQTMHSGCYKESCKFSLKFAIKKNLSW